MTTSNSTALVNALAAKASLVNIFTGGRLYFYGNTRVADSNTDPGVGVDPLVIVTAGAGAWQDAVRATAVIELAGVAGQVDSIKLGGAAFNLLAGVVAMGAGTLAALCNAVAAAINTTANTWDCTAVSDGATKVTLSLPAWMGAGGNGLTVVVAASGGITATINGADADTFGATGGTATVGVDAVNGLLFDPPPTAGVLAKLASQVWKGYALGNGQLKWFRLVAPGSLPTGTGASNVRLDGSVGTDIVADPDPNVLTDAPVTIKSFSPRVI